ncbi:MAG TPA: hypothetical protein VEA16_03410 [Vicinamibacterales bacterium]|nr:hypothetical protein [Vicinamibacterales bacterium]
MSQTIQEFVDGLRQFAEIIGWLVAGAVLGAALAHWQAPGNQTASVASMLLLPGTVVLGWVLMFPVALLALPLLIPRLIRWLRNPLPRPDPTATPRVRVRRASAIGWVFVAAALPTSLVAGFIAGAPLTYLLAGLAYGYLLRHSAALQDVQFT